jgi:hypothetical protein
MEKIYLNDRQDFIEWKVKHTDYLGNLQAIEYDEKEPLSYPCILIENDEYNESSYVDKYYGFVYLTDFITN